MSTYINWYSQSFFDRIPENITLCITQTLSFSFNRDVHFLYFFFVKKANLQSCRARIRLKIQVDLKNKMMVAQ